MKSILGLVAVVITSVGTSSFVFANTPPTTVERVDLKRYLGVWYELATIPASFQNQCLGNTTAEYRLTDDNLIQVLNSCDVNRNGERETAEGRARVKDQKTNAKLKVTFVKIFGQWIFQFGGDYWVIDLAPDYSYAVVGHPTREFGWILSRTPQVSKTTVNQIAQNLVKQGYDLCQFLVTFQGPIGEKRRPLCEVL